MDVTDDGRIQLTGFKLEKLTEAEEFVKLLVAPKPRGGPGGKDKPEYAGPEPIKGEIYKGKIMGTHNFGVFLEIIPGAEDGSTPGLEGLCHVSELAQDHVRNCEGFVKSMNVDELDVVYLGKNDRGKLQLSRKAALEAKANGKKPVEVTRPPPAEKMSEDEVDVIAEAIEGVSEL
jgi:polyribonucleotide nucleotidyltransferase